MTYIREARHKPYSVILSAAKDLRLRAGFAWVGVEETARFFTAQTEFTLEERSDEGFRMTK